ncbi:MAG TPA: VOC family protein [Acidimicrobiales bacterium]|jgi:catechol 2,3-dioxygenase-like lactoylglutathione lyase family enzyme|nr:VOC family protein [Acidimicrobiales bacterium]
MPICSGPVVQTAWVSNDLTVAKTYLADVFGADHWTAFDAVEFGPESCVYQGRPADFVADIALTYVGDMQLELIRPVRGQSIYTEFLEASGPGLHHICFEVDDMPAALDRAGAAGIEVAQHGSMFGLMDFAYLDGRSAGVPYIELARIGGEMRAIFDQIRTSAGRRQVASSDP